MKKKAVAAMLALTCTLGACGTTEPAVQETVTETIEQPQSAEETTAPEKTPAQETPAETSETPATEEGAAQTAQGEETLPVTGSGQNENLTEGIEKIEAPAAGITEEQIGALSKVSMDLLAESVAFEGNHPNVLLSPTSIAIAFGMAENGATGDTLADMERVIGGGIPIDEMNPLLYNMTEHLRNANGVDWNVANSVWFRDDGMWRVKDEFAAKALSWYGADVWKAPFDDTTTVAINNWVSEQTKGMIPEVIKQIPRDAGMYLINALAFEGEWMEEYEDDDILENRQFTNADGSKTDVTMLASTENAYFELGDGIGFLKEYKGGEYSFMGILPEKGTDLDDYIASLAAGDADLAEAIRNCTYGTVIVQIPEFQKDYSIEMVDVLENMGMTLPFLQGIAEFTEMMETVDGSPYDVWIGNVLHKTHIEVDRAGTRAAAVTVIEMDRCGAIMPVEDPVRVILDRPFIYGIIDNETGLPVFLGCVNSL